MKIIHKLTLGYLIVSLFFMIVAIVGVLTINNINVAFDELSKENIPVVEALENVKTLGLKMGLASSEFVLIRSESKNINISLDEIEKEDRKLAIEELDAAISRYEKLINKFYPDEKDADKQRFKQVLFNLLSNAVKFTPIDGTVTIRTKKEGNMAHISVSDTGIGIREENIG